MTGLCVRACQMRQRGAAHDCVDEGGSEVAALGAGGFSWGRFECYALRGSAGNSTSLAAAAILALPRPHKISRVWKFVRSAELMFPLFLREPFFYVVHPFALLNLPRFKFFLQ